MLTFFNVWRNSSLHIPCWLYFYLGSFSYTSYADFIFFFFIAGSFSYTSRTGFVCIWGVSLTHPMLALVSVGSFSYTSHVNFFSLFFRGVYLDILCLLFFLFFFLILGVSITHPVLAFTCGEFLLHIPCWLYIYLGSFSYTSRSGFIFILGVSLTHPTLPLIFFFFFFFLNSEEFLLHIPCWLHFYAWSFADSSRSGFISIWGVSLTHPMLALFFFIFLI